MSGEYGGVDASAFLEHVGAMTGAWDPEEITAVFERIEYAADAALSEPAELRVQAIQHGIGLCLATAVRLALEHPGNDGLYDALQDLIYSLEDVRQSITSRRLLPYSAYLNASHWQTKRVIALERAGYRCHLCNSDKRLNVHHRHYDHMWDEQPDDLIVLCRRCHAKHHDKLP